MADPTGADLPGATVSLLREATGEIEIGEYMVKVTVQGFKTEESSGIKVQLRQKSRVNMVRPVGSTNDSNEVRSSGWS